MRKHITISVFILLLIFPVAFGIGVSPARKIVDFEASLKEEFELTLRNDGIKDIAVKLSSNSEYVTFREEIIQLSASSEITTMYTLNLPNEILKPGIHKYDIQIKEFLSSYGAGSDTTIAASASVISELWIRVPYPGIYAEGKLYIDSKNISDPVRFTIGIVNLGKVPIENIQATIQIFDTDKKEVANIKTQTLSLDNKQSDNLERKWIPTVPPGRYSVIATVIYDEHILKLEQDFSIGNLFITISRIDVRDFTLGDIAAFHILLSSEWNAQIDNVYADITILSAENEEIAQIRSISTDIPPLGEALVKAYWDTKNVKVGKYTLRFLIHYADKITEKLVETEVNIDSIHIELGPTAQVIAGAGGEKRAVFNLILIIAIVSLIANVAWFSYFFKRKKKEK